jgi:hypothetical protein
MTGPSRFTLFSTSKMKCGFLIGRPDKEKFEGKCYWNSSKIVQNGEALHVWIRTGSGVILDYVAGRSIRVIVVA